MLWASLLAGVNWLLFLTSQASDPLCSGWLMQQQGNPDLYVN